MKHNTMLTVASLLSLLFRTMLQLPSPDGPLDEQPTNRPKVSKRFHEKAGRRQVLFLGGDHR
jgi:hypothetical protein